MQKAQRPIVVWMKQVLDRHADEKLTPRSWALKAGLGPNTVSRAMNENYPHITSMKTIAKLADCIGEVIPRDDFVRKTDNLPSVATLAQVLGAIADVLGADRPRSDELLRALAVALRDTLAVLAEDPEVADDPNELRIVARTLARRISQKDDSQTTA